MMYQSNGHAGGSGGSVPIDDANEQTETGVLIVGAGPCGLLQAYLLSKLNGK
jgi:ribulose 1,5-bisphosphate synthetase/thiazole synthase